jgi:hypothetical protein
VRANGIGPRFGPGNEARLVHGLRRTNPLDAQPIIAADLAARRDRVLADLGGPDAVAFTKARLAVSFARCDLMLDDLFGRLVADGIFTSKGRVRSAYNAMLLLLDRHLRLAQAVGLERRARRVPDLDAYLARTYGAQRPQDAREARADADVVGDDERLSVGRTDAAAGEGER